MSQSSSSGRRDGRAAVTAVLSLGSNIGERERRVLDAAARIASSPGVRSARLSSLYETAPQGEGYSRNFINAVMIVRTTLGARALLGLALGLEREAGRTRGGLSGDRTLDIDIILHGDSVIDEDDLTVPHPRLFGRRFVLAPLAELEPGFRLPGGLTAAEAALSDGAEGWVSRVSSRSRTGRKSL